MIAFGLVTLVALVAFSGRLLAQGTSSGSRGAIRPILGAYVPTGDQREFLKDAVLAGAQASLNFGSNFAGDRLVRLGAVEGQDHRRAIRRSTRISTTSVSRSARRRRFSAGSRRSSALALAAERTATAI
jgi:hypothetical protein